MKKTTDPFWNKKAKLNKLHHGNDNTKALHVHERIITDKNAINAMFCSFYQDLRFEMKSRKDLNIEIIDLRHKLYNKKMLHLKLSHDKIKNALWSISEDWYRWFK